MSSAALRTKKSCRVILRLVTGKQMVSESVKHFSQSFVKRRSQSAKSNLLFDLNTFFFPIRLLKCGVTIHVAPRGSTQSPAPFALRLFRFCSSSKPDFRFWAAAPKGTKSCRTQGTFVRSFVRLSIRSSPPRPSQA